MFNIILTPINSPTELEIAKAGDVLIINNTHLDFSDMPDDGEYPPEAFDNPFIEGGASKVNGVVSLTVRMPYTNPEPPHSVAFPDPIIVDIDGVVELPEGRFADGDQ